MRLPSSCYPRYWVAGLLAVRSRVLASTPRRTFSLTFPRELPAEAVVDAIRALHGLLPPSWQRLIRVPVVIVETIGTADGVTHQITVAGSLGQTGARPASRGAAWGSAWPTRRLRLPPFLPPAS